MFLFCGFLQTFFFFFELVFCRLADFLRFFYSGGSQIFFFFKRPNFENNDVIDRPRRRTIAEACAPALNFHLSLIFVVFLLLRRNFWVGEFLSSSFFFSIFLVIPKSLIEICRRAGWTFGSPSPCWRQKFHFTIKNIFWIWEKKQNIYTQNIKLKLKLLHFIRALYNKLWSPKYSNTSPPLHHCLSIQNTHQLINTTQCTNKLIFLMISTIH